MNRNIALVVGLSIIVLLGVFWFIRSRSNPATTLPDYSQTSSPAEASDQAQQKPATDGAMMVEGTKEFNVTGSNFKYDPGEIKVKKGTKVTINFKSESGLHDLIVEGLDVATKRLQSGESESVSFTADTVGTFEYYCSVGTHRQMGMKGNLIVE